MKSFLSANPQIDALLSSRFIQVWVFCCIPIYAYVQITIQMCGIVEGCLCCPCKWKTPWDCSWREGKLFRVPLILLFGTMPFSIPFLVDVQLPWWPCGLRCCHWLLVVFHHCPGSNPTRGMLESCQWLEVRRWFFPGSLVSCTSYIWLVTTSPKYGRKRDEKRNSKFSSLKCLCMVYEDLPVLWHQEVWEKGSSYPED